LITERNRATLNIGVLHGPNLNLLGEREPDVYGAVTLQEIDERLQERATALGAQTTSFQSNYEGELVGWVQTRAASVDGWLVNAAGYTHGSVALRDALVASGRPFVEVHLTNIFAREPFRRISVLADAALGIIAGFHASSYVMGLEALVEHLRERR
jgi:3-dehydroquinate dehydratase-2